MLIEVGIALALVALVWAWGHVMARLDAIMHRQAVAFQQGGRSMAVGQEILDAVRQQTTLIQSFIALVDGLVADNTISPETAAAIKSALAENTAVLEAAIAANTPGAPAEG